MKEPGVGVQGTGSSSTVAAPASSVGKSTLASQVDAQSAPGTLSLGTSKAGTLDALRSAVAARSRDAANTAYQQLAPAARTQLRSDVALIGELVAVLDSAAALRVLAQLRLDRKTTLQVAAEGRFMDGPFLASVLQQLGIKSIAAVTGAAADLIANPVFTARYLLDPIINGATATSKQQLLLATSNDGTTLLRRVYPGESPLRALAKLGSDDKSLREGYLRDTEFGNWLFATPSELEASITMGTDGADWARALWGGRHQSILMSWIHKDAGYWGNSFALGFVKPEPSDAAALRSLRPLRGAIFDAIARTHTVSHLLVVFDKLGFALGEWITSLEDTRRLDLANLQLALEGPGIGPADQAQLAGDDEAIALVKNLSAGKRPSEVFHMLAGAPAQFCAAVGKPSLFSSWIVDDPTTLAAEMTAVVDWPGWVTAFRSLGQPLKILEASRDPNVRAQLRQGLTATTSWTWFFKSLPQPVPEQAQVDVLFGLYGDGSGIAVADKYLLWSALYRTPLKRAGEDVVIPWTETGARGEIRYIGANPSDATMKYFYTSYRQMPRAHIDTAKSVVFSQFYTVKKITGTTETFIGADNKPTAAPGLTPVTTSLYTGSNDVVMRAVDGAGNSDTRINADNFVGLPGQAPGAVNRSRRGLAAPDLTFFQNHATHEIGHAVGNRTLKVGKYNIKGNDFAKQYAQWKDGGSAVDYARMLGFSGGLDMKIVKLTPTGGSGIPSPKFYMGMQVREFLTGIVENGLASQSSHRLATELGGPDAALNALQQDSAVSGTTLWKTVHQIKGDFPSGGWQFPHGIDNAPVVTMRADKRWQQYHGDAWRHRVSHYSMYSVGENFAEMYTARYTHGQIPPKIGNNDPADFFLHLTRAEPTELGLPAPAKPSKGASDDPAHAGNDSESDLEGENAAGLSQRPPTRPWP